MMNSYLIDAEYILDPVSNVWSRPEYSGITYSDGDEVEERITSIISSAADLSVLSNELRAHCKDWPSTYHLSSIRSNILRPFQSSLKGDILEVGAGCGAITRYLGECGGNVLALEGTPRRAAIARSRTRDLLNVTVLSESFESFSAEQKFDVITLIGVLEYANLFSASSNPALSMLKRVQSLLKPNGRLFIAIENQLGLKYFAGAPEDHLSQPMYGIEGRYKKDQPQTYGRSYLLELLQQAKFLTCNFLLPFPDYKLPVSIIPESGLDVDGFDAAALAWQSVWRDPQLPASIGFSLELAWPIIFQNKLAVDLANSFLIVASPSKNVFTSEDILGYHYSMDRAPEFCKETTFRINKETQKITVNYKRMLNNLEHVDNAKIIKFTCPQSDDYHAGDLLAHEYIKLLSADGWNIEDIKSFFSKYLNAIGCLLNERNFLCDLTSPYSLIPGCFFDATASNLIVRGDGPVVLVDNEWELSSPMELGHLLFRMVLQLIASVSHYGKSAYDDITRGEFVNLVFDSLGLSLAAGDLERYLAIEEEITEYVLGRPAHDVVQWLPNQPLNTQRIYKDSLINEINAKHLYRTINDRDDQIQALHSEAVESSRKINNHKAHVTHLEEVISERDLQIAHLSQEREDLVAAVTERNNQKAQLEEVISERDLQVINHKAHITHLEQVISERDLQLEAIYESKSWALTKPFRTLRAGFTSLKPPYRINERQYRILKKIVSGLPLSTPLRSRLRSKLRLEKSSSSNIVLEGSEVINHITDDQFTTYNHFWADYQPLAKAIKSYERASIELVNVQPKTLINFSKSDLVAVAKKLKFKVTEKPKVSIVLPVFESIHMTLECLESVSQSKVAASYEIIVADDASRDQTLEILLKVDGIKVNSLSSNAGFLKNCNEAFKLADGEYVVILNSDVQVSDGWLDGLLDVFNEYGDAGTVGPKIIYPSGHLQEAGVALNLDGTPIMVGLNDDPNRNCYSYIRAVDYCSGACLMIKASILKELNGFSEEFAPAYYEDADLGMRVLRVGYKNYFTPNVTVVHHLSKTMEKISPQWKRSQTILNGSKFFNRWADDLDSLSRVRAIAFYLPQFHVIEENNIWWGQGFTEWTNVRKAAPNFIGHYQPRIPADLGYYDLTDIEVIKKQILLAQKYGVDGFCFYYYWFGGKRLLETPVNLMIESKLDFPFCLCWANENWSRRWDGRDADILISQKHSPEDDLLVILDLIRYFKANSYIHVNGKPLLLIYRVDLFPNFKETSARWRDICRSEGVGEIYLALVESHDLVHKNIDPSIYGCDASVEFPPLNMAEQTAPSGELVNSNFSGGIADYRKTVLAYCARELPSYKRFRGVMPGWDNTARRQNSGFIFEHSSPGAFQAWLEFVMKQTNQYMHGDERIVFINAWNEWAEGAYLEPDNKYGHSYLEAVRNARDACLHIQGGSG